MFDPVPTVIIELLQVALFALFVIGCSLSLLFGVILLASPTAGLKLNRYMNQWISMRRPSKPLEIPHHTESLVYKRHKLFGLVMMAGSCYILYRLGFQYDHNAALSFLVTTYKSPFLVDWLLSAFLSFIVPVMLIILLIGAVFAVRPSSLKGLETGSNRWISTRRWLLPLEKPYLLVDQFIGRAPRKFALIIIVLSLYSLTSLLLIYIHL